MAASSSRGVWRSHTAVSSAMLCRAPKMAPVSALSAHAIGLLPVAAGVVAMLLLSSWLPTSGVVTNACGAMLLHLMCGLPVLVLG